MSNSSIKSVESISEDNMFTSQTTQNKSQKIYNLKTEPKENKITLNNNSDDEEKLLRNKLLIEPNDELNTHHKLSSKDVNTSTKKSNLGLSLSPIKKGFRKRNLFADIMEKSKKKNPKRTSVIFQMQQNKMKEENKKDERKDVYGVPINKRNKKKIKVTFSDTINIDNKNGQNKLAEVIPIVSYKKYNYIEGLPREENLVNTKSTCQCCLIS